MVDVATVNTVSTAATAQSAAVTPASLDAIFGALLQAMSGDPSSGALTASPNTTALPITNFSAATLIQNTVSDTAPAASNFGAAADATPDNGTPGNDADTKASDAATGLLALWQLTPQTAPTMPAAAPQQTPQQMPQQGDTVAAQDAVTNSAAQAIQTASAASTIWSASAVPVVKLRSTVVASTTDAPSDNTAADNKATAESTVPSNSATMDAASGQFALWQLQAAPMAAAPQQESTAPVVTAANMAAPVTAATGGSAIANNPAKSDDADQTDPSTAQPTTADQTDQTVANQVAALQIASNQSVTNQTVPAAADPAASVGTVPDKTAALAAAQALAAARGTENGTADLKLKAKLRTPDDVKASGDKSKSASSDKTGVEPATGLKNSPIQPRQDGQTPNDQALNNSSPSATVAQPAAASLSDGHAAKADASAAQTVSVSPLASEPQKIAADLQVATGHNGDDTSATLDKLGVTIAAKSLQGLHQFDIRLDPPDLGRVQVKLTVDDSGQAQASLVVDKPQTLDLLQRDSSSLNRVLTDSGLNLSNNGLSFSLRDQQQQTDGGTNKGRSRSLSAKAALTADSSTIRSTSGSYAPNSVRLDIRV